jgi:ribose transport system ATP-binding protein
MDKAQIAEPSYRHGGSAPMLEVVSIRKRFGATQALDDVDLDLRAGEVHALAGENGAGKSTLGKIISGLYKQDEGTILLDGVPVGRWDTHKAQRHGVVLIAQELSLVPELSVADNVFLGVEHHRFGTLQRDVKNRFEDLNASAGFDLRSQDRVGSLRIADQQKVEIMRALARDARLIIMDEPTSSLTSDEVDKLHVVIKSLSAQGRTVVYISHFLEALLSTSDRVTVMRDGRKVKTANSEDESKQSIVEAMLGRSLVRTFPPRPPRPPNDVEPKIEVRSISGDNGVRDVSLVIRPGEIVGLAGLVGSGRSEIARLIFGADPLSSGDILVDGKRIDKPGPRDSARRGIVMIPEDRRAEGLILVRSIRENVSLPHLELVAKSGVLARSRESMRVSALVKRLAVLPPRIASPVADLSGGNQQKVLFAKWLMGNPSVIILDEPTRGVDIGAKVNIYEIITKLAEDGAAILMISSEHEEVLALSHRVFLVRDGGILKEIDPQDSSVDDVLLSLFDIEKNDVKGNIDER